jgi:ribosome maturation factor RimP
VSGVEPTETLLDLLRPSLIPSGLDVEAVEISSAGRRRVVRVLVDKDGGVTLDDLADATRVVGDRLDETDALGERPYTLEVTSPGIDRPLTAPRHWRRNVGRLVSFTLSDGVTVTGRIVAADDETATVDVDGQPRGFGYRAITKARIQIEFNRPRPAEEA